MYPTPRSSGQENPETLIKRERNKSEDRQGTGSNKMIKDVSNTNSSLRGGGEQSERVERTKSGGFVSEEEGNRT